MSEYRYAVDPSGSITRARVHRLPDDWTTDSWRWYWDGDMMVAITESFGVRHEFYGTTDNEDTERVLHAVKMHREYGGEDYKDHVSMLNRPGGLAFRLTGNWDARFIHVSLDRGADLYALSWDGDPENEWRDEIEALNWGDVYRMEVQRYDANAPSPGWYDEDEYPDEWYGEDKATAELERVFTLDEFPAELLVKDRAS